MRRGLLMLALASCPASLAAQSPPRNGPPANAAPSDAAWRNLAHSCTAEADRLCPTGSSDPHEEALCLKFYRSSLSLQCRAALDAVTH